MSRAKTQFEIDIAKKVSEIGFDEALRRVADALYDEDDRATAPAGSPDAGTLLIAIASAVEELKIARDRLSDTSDIIAERAHDDVDGAICTLEGALRQRRPEAQHNPTLAQPTEWKASELGEAAWLAFRRARGKKHDRAEQDWDSLSCDLRKAWSRAAVAVAKLANPRDESRRSEATPVAEGWSVRRTGSSWGRWRAVGPLRDTEAEAEDDLPGEEEEWADRPTPDDEAIQAVFPTRSNRHDLYREAQRLVGPRHGKFALLAMVNWLLHRIEQAEQRSAAAQPEPCCYEAPAGIHSENCPTRAEDASTPCRKCTECEGNHHWLETLAYVCKHCELLAEGCEDCDGTGGFDGDVDSEIPCEACDGDGVIVPNQRRAAATGAGNEKGKER